MTSVKRLAGAVVIGLGAVLGGGRRDRHWSEKPVVEVVDEEQAASGDELDDPALVLLERRLRAAEVDLDELSGGPTAAVPHGRSPAAGRHREAEGRLAALLDARRAVRRGSDARLAVGVTVASWEGAVTTASHQGPTWLAYRWAGAQELSALADELAALDRPDDHPAR